MKKLVCIASLCLGVFTSGAFAADVTVNGSLNETLEAGDNYFLLNSPSGTTAKSLSTVNLDVLARTPGTRYLLSSNFSYYNYFGPGADQTSPTSGTAVNETFHVDHTTDLARYFFTTTWHRSDLAATQLQESGVVTGTGETDTFRAAGGGTHDLNRTDSLSWSAQAARTTFTASAQTPYSDLGGSLAWIHLLNPTTTLTTSATFDWYDADDLVKSRRLFWQFMTGLKSQLTRRLTVSASVGTTFANTWQDAPFMPIASTTPTAFQTGASNGAVGTVIANYQLLKNTALTASAAHLIIPTTTGQLQKTTTAGFSIGHNINHWSSIAFSANLAHTDNSTIFVTTGPADFFSAQVAYSYQLARDWHTRLSYTYRQRNDDTGTARANVVLLSLAYNFNLLGNPNALDQVETERALLRQQRAIGEVFPTLQ